MRNLFAAFTLGLILALVGGYAWFATPRDGVIPVDMPVGSKSETFAVGEVLDGIRGMNRLIVFRSYLTAVTRTTETNLIGMEAKQTTITPAFVNYYVDLDAMRAEDVRIDGDTLRVKLPRLMIERPNVDVTRIEVIDQGLWSSLSDADKRNWKKNSNKAMKQLFERAQMKILIEAARDQALKSMVQNTRKIADRAGGLKLKVVVSF
ncbi:hypothetical protein NSE01_37020 [Novosphingobium sediminis]|uniref:DUF4230 domain-containing protein n=1 Tax=Novosphingobium sediminis TaxID=707214 RepID=A0A512AQB0_9SPHN|nr:DUF4230 domain-containing protein [Novosphingobium sediminis]GEO01870.1 hypothetical protein NSE01_37020 [Novosphingobium sediminis]